MNPRVLYRAATYATDARSAADSVISALTPAAWYRNATGVTQAGGFASQWDDYSGNGRHLVQGAGTNQPAYSAGVFTFDGVDNFIKASAFTLNQPFSVIWVGRQKAWTVQKYIHDGNTQASAMLYQNATTPELRMFAGGASAGSTSATIDLPVIVASVFNGASSFMRVNGNSDVAQASIGAGNPGGFTLGGSSVGNYSNILAIEVVIFDTALSSQNVTSVITALNNALTVF